MLTSAPTSRALALGSLVSLVSLVLVAGCADQKENQVLQPFVVGMTTNTAAFYSDGQVTLYQVQIPVPLPMRRPGDAEQKVQGPAPPLPRMPFLKQEDVEITVRFTLANLDDESRTVELLVDPWNEFVRYKPMIQVVSDEETAPDFSGFDKYFVLGPKERFEGVITPDDTKELAVDLATAESLIKAPPPNEADGVNGLVNRAFNLQNRSSRFDPLLTPTIDALPAVPGLVGFDLGLRTTAAMNVAVEVIIDVRDIQGDRVVPPGKTDKTFGTPGTTLSPPAPARN
jgi:hypothetical protein